MEQVTVFHRVWSMPAFATDSGRLGGRVVLVIALLILGGRFATSLAQDSPKKTPVDEKQPAPSRPSRNPSDADNRTLKTDPRQPAPRLADLVLLAEQTEHPGLRKLYRSLAIPHDVITRKQTGEKRVEPIPQYLGPSPPGEGSVTLRFFNDQWRAL